MKKRAGSFILFFLFTFFSAEVVCQAEDKSGDLWMRMNFIAEHIFFSEKCIEKSIASVMIYRLDIPNDPSIYFNFFKNHKERLTGVWIVDFPTPCYIKEMSDSHFFDQQDGIVFVFEGQEENVQIRRIVVYYPVVGLCQVLFDCQGDCFGLMNKIDVANLINKTSEFLLSREEK